RGRARNVFVLRRNAAKAQVEVGRVLAETQSRVQLASARIRLVHDPEHTRSCQGARGPAQRQRDRQGHDGQQGSPLATFHDLPPVSFFVERYSLDCTGLASECHSGSGLFQEGRNCLSISDRGRCGQLVTSSRWPAASGGQTVGVARHITAPGLWIWRHCGNAVAADVPALWKRRCWGGAGTVETLGRCRRPGAREESPEGYRTKTCGQRTTTSGRGPADTSTSQANSSPRCRPTGTRRPPRAN